MRTEKVRFVLQIDYSIWEWKKEIFWQEIQEREERTLRMANEVEMDIILGILFVGPQKAHLPASDGMRIGVHSNS